MRIEGSQKQREAGDDNKETTNKFQGQKGNSKMSVLVSIPVNENIYETDLMKEDLLRMWSHACIHLKHLSCLF